MLSGITWHQLAAHKGKFGAAIVVGRLHCCVCMSVKLISHFLRQSQLITLLMHLPHPITCTFAIGSHFNDFYSIYVYHNTIHGHFRMTQWNTFQNLSFVYCILDSYKNLHIFYIHVFCLNVTEIPLNDQLNDIFSNFISLVFLHLHVEMNTSWVSES